MVSKRLTNALIGAVVTVVTSFVPFSPVLGGAVAGYLQRGDNEEGATVGAISGSFVAIPLAILGTLFAAIVTIVPEGGGAGVGLFALVFLTILLVSSVYSVAFSALGGVLGAYLAREYRQDDEFGDGTVGGDVRGGETGEASDAAPSTAK